MTLLCMHNRLRYYIIRIINTKNCTNTHAKTAITFNNLEDGQPLPKNIEYSIRLHHSTPNVLGDIQRDSWETGFVYPFFQRKGPDGRE